MAMKKMNDDELLALARQELEQAQIQGSSQIQEQRETSYSIYTNQLVGRLKASTGLSSVWFNEHFSYSQRLNKLITKGLTEDEDIVVLETKNEKLIPAAKQAQCILNWALMKNNCGYKVIDRSVLDALINKLSVTKVWWDYTPVMWEEEVDIGEGNIDDYIAFRQNMMGADVEIMVKGKPQVVMEEESYEDYDDNFDMEIEQTQETLVSQVYTLEFMVERGLRWEAIPREEFVTNAEVVSLDDDLTRFIGHRREVMIGDIVSMYPKHFKKLQRMHSSTLQEAADMVAADDGTTSNISYDFERLNRFAVDGTYTITGDEGEANADPMTRQVELIEGYYKCDYNKNGKMVWLKMCWAGNEIFEKSVVEDHPFAIFSAFPIPHKLDGQSIYDVIEYELLALAGMIRSKVDNSIQRNIVRLVTSKKNGVDDRNFSQGRPGPIHVKNMHEGAVKFIETPQGANDSIQVMQYIDQKISSKIGITSVNDGSNVDLLKSGNDAAKMQTAFAQANANIEGYIREYTESMIRPILWKAFKLILDNADSYYVMNAIAKNYGMENSEAGLPTPIPFYAAEDGKREWFDKADFIAKVGLGNLNRQEKLQHIQMGFGVIGQLKEMGIPITPNKVLALGRDTFKYLGLDNYTDYIPSEMELDQLLQEQQQHQEKATAMAEMGSQAEIEETAAKTRAHNAKATKDETDASLMPAEFELKRIQTEAEIELNSEPKFQ